MSNEEKTNRRMDIIGQNGNTGEHYENERTPEKGEMIKVWDHEDHGSVLPFFAMDGDKYVCYDGKTGVVDTYSAWQNAKPIEQPKQEKWYKILKDMQYNDMNGVVDFRSFMYIDEKNYSKLLKDNLSDNYWDLIKTYLSKEEMLNDLKQ